MPYGVYWPHEAPNEYLSDGGAAEEAEGAARKTGAPMAELVRRALDEYLRKRKPER